MPPFTGLCSIFKLVFKPSGATMGLVDYFKTDNTIDPSVKMSQVKSAFFAYILLSEKWRGISRSVFTGVD